jgi:hypothetical protein
LKLAFKKVEGGKITGGHDRKSLGRNTKYFPKTVSRWSSSVLCIHVLKNGKLSQGQRLEEDAVPTSPFSRFFLAFETCARTPLFVQQKLGSLSFLCVCFKQVLLVFFQPVTIKKNTNLARQVQKMKNGRITNCVTG